MCSSYYQDSSPGLEMAIHPQLQTGHKVDLVFLVQQLLFGTRLGSPGCLVVSNTMLHGECFPLLLEDGLLLHSASSLEPLVCVIAMTPSQITVVLFQADQSYPPWFLKLINFMWLAFWTIWYDNAICFIAKATQPWADSQGIWSTSCVLCSPQAFGIFELFEFVCSVFPGTVLSHTFSSRFSPLLQSQLWIMCFVFCQDHCCSNWCVPYSLTNHGLKGMSDNYFYFFLWHASLFLLKQEKSAFQWLYR